MKLKLIVFYHINLFQNCSLNLKYNTQVKWNNFMRDWHVELIQSISFNIIHKQLLDRFKKTI